MNVSGEETKYLAHRDSGLVGFPGKIQYLSSIDELPNSIRIPLQTHLQKRLGTFYDKIHFAQSYYVNLSEMHRLYPYTMSWPFKADYFLTFKFSAPNKGIEYFGAEIQLNEKGEVVSEIELPDLASNPLKGDLISRKEARQLALADGYPNAPEEPQIDYDRTSDSFVWSVRKRVSDNGLTFIIKTLFLDAHSGKVIKETETRGIR